MEEEGSAVSSKTCSGVAVHLVFPTSSTQTWGKAHTLGDPFVRSPRIVPPTARTARSVPLSLWLTWTCWRGPDAKIGSSTPQLVAQVRRWDSSRNDHPGATWTALMMCQSVLIRWPQLQLAMRRLVAVLLLNMVPDEPSGCPSIAESHPIGTIGACDYSQGRKSSLGAREHGFGPRPGHAHVVDMAWWQSPVWVPGGGFLPLAD